jgi:hypothetical protein
MLWILAIALVVFIGCSPKEKKTELTFLRTQGHDMVDEQGNKVFLQSIGLGNWLLPEGYMWKFGNDGDRPRKIEKLVSDLIGDEMAEAFWKDFRANYITEADIIRIKELGFNSVRPALNARLFLTEEDNPQFIDEGFLLLDSLVTWCKKHELYVIIDMHGAPGGQTGQNIDDSPNDLPELFMDVKHQDALVKLWLEIAGKYKDEPTVAAYDLLNEPLPHRTGAAKEYGHLLEPLYKRLTAEIRKIDTKHMITLEGANWSNGWSFFGLPFDDNTFYQFHYYCWDNPDNLIDISYFLKHRDTLNTPIWVGETGEKASNIYFATTQYFEKNNVGWSFWPWKKMDTKNTPYSINKPANWDLITEYTRGGEKPDSVIAQQAFAELLENIKISNCVYFEDVTNAIFRRLPLKIEAENYLHGNYNEAYYVSDTTKKSEYYRKNEFVPVELLAIDSTTHGWKWLTQQCIVLQKDEWVNFSFNVIEERDYTMVVKISAQSSVDAIQINLADAEFVVNTELQDWTELSAGAIHLKEGENSLKIKSLNSNVKIDWIDIK